MRDCEIAKVFSLEIIEQLIHVVYLRILLRTWNTDGVTDEVEQNIGTAVDCLVKLKDEFLSLTALVEQ